MSPTFRLQRLSRHGLLLLAAALLLITAASATADNGCTKVHGKVTVTQKPCESPFGCGDVTLTGVLKGTGTTTVTSFTPSPDPDQPYIFFTTNDGVWNVRGGQLFTEESVVLKLGNPAVGAEVITIEGGTGVWEGASGTLTAESTADMTTGVSEGAYHGEICTP